jgi:hypothetical protein
MSGSRTTRGLSLSLFASVAMTLASSGAANAGDGADDLISRGLLLRRESKPTQALEMFQKAHATAPSPRTLGQMGLVETSLEHWLDAEAHLRASLATPDDAWVRKNRAFLDQALAVTQKHVGELVITGPIGTEVAVDGTRVGTLPAIRVVRLAEGKVVVVANSAGFRQFSKTVAIAGGARVSLAIVLDPVERRPAIALSAPVPASLAAEALPLASAYDHRPAWRTWTGTGLVAAGAGLLAWGIVWIAVDGNDQCAVGGASCTTVYDTRTPGWILAAGGAAVAAGGTALLLTGNRDDGPNVMFAVSPSSLLLRGRF